MEAIKLIGYCHLRLECRLQNVRVSNRARSKIARKSWRRASRAYSEHSEHSRPPPTTIYCLQKGNSYFLFMWTTLRLKVISVSRSVRTSMLVQTYVLVTLSQSATITLTSAGRCREIFLLSRFVYTISSLLQSSIGKKNTDFFNKS